jgi:RimJ/RimL family protein N-acetyltransferase
MPANYVYILRCADGTLYTGWTNDLPCRIQAHCNGTGSKYTRSRLPVKLAYYEKYEDKRQAQQREYAIKQFSREEKESLINSVKNIQRKVVETERLILREMIFEDLPALREIVQDEQTMYAWNGAWNEAETVEGLEKQLNSYSENGFGRWAVDLKGTGRTIGICGLMWQDTDSDRVLEIGYLFNRAFWHNGFAAEASVACRKHAFDVLDYDEVFSLIRDNNYASMNVAIRCGMFVRDRYTKNYKGEDMPHYIFSVRKKEK